MKALHLLMLVGVCLTGCGQPLNELNLSSPRVVHVSQPDSDQQLELGSERVLELSLAATPSTGYAWSFTPVPGLALVGEPQFIPEGDLPGMSGIIHFRFRPVLEWEGELKFEYLRSWEEQAPIRSFRLKVATHGPFLSSDEAEVLFRPTSPSLIGSSVRRDAIQLNACVPDASLPAALNWCASGRCTPVKYQSNCGSCWAFATTAVFESSILLKDWTERDLSEQYLISCNSELWGCGGGLEAHDYHRSRYVSSEFSAGAVYETEFPYVARDVTCGAAHPHHEVLTQWYRLPTNASEACIKSAILRNGPVATDICATSDLHAYSSGVLNSNQTCVLGITNHMVTIVGWNDATSSWIIKNSWSSAWGERGYARIRYGTLNIGTSVTYVAYAGSDAQRAALMVSALF